MLQVFYKAAQAETMLHHHQQQKLVVTFKLEAVEEAQEILTLLEVVAMAELVTIMMMLLHRLVHLTLSVVEVIQQIQVMREEQQLFTTFQLMAVMEDKAKHLQADHQEVQVAQMQQI
jgi:hypothetical protein